MIKIIKFSIKSQSTIILLNYIYNTFDSTVAPRITRISIMRNVSLALYRNPLYL